MILSTYYTNVFQAFLFNAQISYGMEALLNKQYNIQLPELYLFFAAINSSMTDVVTLTFCVSQIVFPTERETPIKMCDYLLEFGSPS